MIEWTANTGALKQLCMHFQAANAPYVVVDMQEEWAARIIQVAARKKGAWGRLLAMLNDVYEKEYDPETECWFYVNKARVRCAFLK